MICWKPGGCAVVLILVDPSINASGYSTNCVRNVSPEQPTDAYAAASTAGGF